MLILDRKQKCAYVYVVLYIHSPAIDMLYTLPATFCADCYSCCFKRLNCTLYFNSSFVSLVVFFNAVPDTHYHEYALGSCFAIFLALVVNPFTAMLANVLLGKRLKVPNLKIFKPFAWTGERTSIRMYSIESSFVIGPSVILFSGVYGCTFQSGNFTGWGSEGVKQLGYFWYIRLQHLKGNCSSLDFIAYTIQLAL